jgi:hypothetical protein
MKENIYVIMLVFELTGEETKLPNVNNWLTPNYRGPEDTLWCNPCGKGQLPKKWKTDFPEYVYTYPQLQELKKKLNAVKSLLNPITGRDREKYDDIADAVRPQDELRGKNGVLVQDYNAEIVTNAWLKMFELLNFTESLLTALSASRTNKIFHSFHFAEAPGNFLLAINHYLKTKHPIFEWSWLANSYRELYIPRSETQYLCDAYGLIKAYPTRWIFGADEDGDITSPANIRSFQQAAAQQLDDIVHLATADVKFCPPDMNFDEEENINIPVHLGQLLASLMVLSKGGTMILKIFTTYEAPSICMLYMITLLFGHVYLVKPETSRPANSEKYIVATGYKNNLTPLQLSRLLNFMGYIRYLNTELGSPALFHAADISKEFINSIIDIETKLTNLQITHLEKNIKLYHEYNDKSVNAAKVDFAKERQNRAAAWIKRTEIQPLIDTDRFIHPVSINKK